MKRSVFVVACLLMAGLCGWARAAPHHDTFFIALEGNSSEWNLVDPTRSGGSGWVGATGAAGPWFHYMSNPGDPPIQDPWGGLPPVPTWVNQWYYDDPFDPLRWKIVTLDFTYALNDPTAQGGGIIVINYSQPGWSPNTVAPPLPGNGDPFVGRIQVDSLWLEGGNAGVYNWSRTYDLRDFGVNFNPEWISIDVAGYNVLLSSPGVPGSLQHECVVPAPAALPGGMMLLCLAGAGLAMRSLRTRR